MQSRFILLILWVRELQWSLFYVKITRNKNVFRHLVSLYSWHLVSVYSRHKVSVHSWHLVSVDSQHLVSLYSLHWVIFLVSRGRMHKSSCGHLSKRRSNSPRRVLENKFIFTNLLSNGICMIPEVKKEIWLILIVIFKMSMASTCGNFFFTKLLEQPLPHT